MTLCSLGISLNESKQHKRDPAGSNKSPLQVYRSEQSTHTSLRYDINIMHTVRDASETIINYSLRRREKSYRDTSVCSREENMQKTSVVA